MANSLLVIDGNSLLNRCFYGVRPLTTADGRQTGALYGLLNILLPYLEGKALPGGAPTHIAAAFDLGAPTFRHKMFPGYKAGRRAMPDELAEQLGPAKDLLAALGIAVLSREGYEADDFLGTLSALAEREGETTAALLTGDRDALQLISPQTTVLLIKTGETISFNEARFREAYGVAAQQYLDVKALMGDSSDAIPGVPGVGEKTAFRLIAQYGSLDALYEAVARAVGGEKLPLLTPAITKKLADGRESADLSRCLARIVRDMEIEGGLSAVRRSPADRERLRELLISFEFAGFLRRLGLSNGGSPSPALFPPGEGEDTARGVATAPAAAGEPSTARPLTPQDEATLTGLRSASLALSEREEPTLLIGTPAGEVLSLDLTSPLARQSTALHDFLAGRTGCAATVFDGKRLRLALRRALPEADLAFQPSFDLMLAGWMLSPESPLDGKDGLSRLLLAHLSIASDGAPAERLLAYYPALREALERKLAAEGLTKLYREVELPLSALLADMEEAGARVDVPGLLSFGEELGARAAALEEEIYALAGHPFNINSPKQLSTVLFEEMGLPARKKTHRGYSTSADVLEELSPYSPIIPLIFDYRQAVKLRSTYALPLAAAADEHSRVHTVYRQTGTATGRLSSAEPNLQNIPVRTPLGREFRRFFLSEQGFVLVDADYSQIELRVLASLAGDEAMLAAFRAGEDIHRATAAAVFGVPPQEVTPEMRTRAKAVNFGIIYGISDYSLARDLGISKASASTIIRSYKAAYPAIDRYLEESIERARACGYSVTALGRRRPIPELRSQKATLRSAGERVARNSPIQGTAADIIKVAMLRADRALREADLRARVILQIHDELIVEAPLDEAEEAGRLLRGAMESVADILPRAVPLSVTLSTAKSWVECK